MGDVTIDYLNEERVKLWQGVEEIKSSLKNAVEVSQRADAENQARLSDEFSKLRTDIENVRALAKAKTPEDVLTARKAAEDAVMEKAKIIAAATEIKEIKSRLPDVDKASKAIRAREASSLASSQKVEELRQQTEAAVNAARKFTTELNQTKSSIDQSFAAASAALNTTTANAQEVANLKAKASGEYSAIEASKSRIEELRSQLDKLNDRFQESIKTCSENFTATHSEYQEKYSSFLKEEQDKVAKLEAEIEGLLPGATSVSLASAFDERKMAVQGNKWIWSTLLIASALAIVAFGVWSLASAQANQPISTFPMRLVIIAGLVVIEEFARRNYNVSTRLAEAYAYKEVVAKSYHGFKNELNGVDAAERDGTAKGSASSILARTFLDKLEDEPGKRVFDRERPAITVMQVLSRLASSNSGEASGADPVRFSELVASAISRVSWPLVAIVFILAASGCFITYMIAK